MASTTLTPADVLGPNGRIALRLSGYESRPQQLEMAAAVDAALRGGHHLVAEAGTGVGKSFAYLVPAILAATEQREAPSPDEDPPPPPRIVVSTHTIALQEQLMEKDIPLLNSVIPREFSAVLVKGRGNYLSRRRLSLARERRNSLFAYGEQSSELERISAWSKETPDGSLADLAPQPLRNVWDEVASDSSNCMGRKCATYAQCFYYKARRRMQHAQILVVNHALFFTDLALRRAKARILPDYDFVIFDEAHTVEDVAGDHLGIRITNGQVDYVLHKLYNPRNQKGLLVHHKDGAGQQHVQHCLRIAIAFFKGLWEWRESSAPANGRVRKPKVVPNPLSEELVNLATRIRNLAGDVKDESTRTDLNAACERLEVLAEEIEMWRTQAVEDAVYWLETSRNQRGYPRLNLLAAPLDVGPALRSQLFERIESVVLTSATLSTGRAGDFDFFKTRLGLTKSESLQVGSPFDYQKNATLITLADAPDPAQQQAAYHRTCVRQVIEYAGRTDGRTFVLFTSYEALRQTASEIAPWCAQQDISLLSQADGMPRTQMVTQFKNNPRSILLGTDSFWQGVDVKGDALKTVIITKLPFAVPDHPLLQARMDRIRARGGNPFGEFQLPAAVLKFKQGFGRLIRSQSDSGTVVVIDPRIRTKSYGKTFIESLPEPRVISASAR